MSAELINLYDSEVQKIQATLNTLKDRTYKRHNLSAFEREVKERFQEVGFVVDVLWYETNVSGVYMPEIEVIGRCDPINVGEFDHDKMRHEVVNNLLGLPEKDAGVIKTNEKWSIEQAKEIHKHGAGCGHE